jgi:urease accessory protein
VIRAARVLSAGAWQAPATDTVVLDHDHRHRRRLAMTGEGGLAFLLDLAETATLRDGDGLALEDGRIVAVKAAAEPLAEIKGNGADDLVRLAWHLGNRHLPTQLAGDRLLIRRDHVIEAMLTSLGARVTHVEAPFDPEGGAYSHGHESHGHGDDGHHHSHA